MSTLLNAITYARQLAQTDSNGITNTLGIAFGNDALQNMTRSLLERGVDASQTQESYTDLTTSSPNTYAWPTDMFALKTIEVNFSDTGQNNYLQAEQVDVANLQGDTSFSYLRANQPTTAPLVDNRGDTYEIFPTPLVANSQGIRIFYFLTPTEYTDTGDTIAYPCSLDYRCLSARIAALYATSQGDLEMAKACNEEYQARLQDIIRILAPGTQQPIKPQKLHLTGWDL
jgi:hypothetical protein